MTKFKRIVASYFVFIFWPDRVYPTERESLYCMFMPFERDNVLEDVGLAGEVIGCFVRVQIDFESGKIYMTTPSIYPLYFWSNAGSVRAM